MTDKNKPIGANSWIVSQLTVIHFLLILRHKSALQSVSPDAGRPLNALLEMRVDRRTADGLDALELT